MDTTNKEAVRLVRRASGVLCLAVGLMGLTSMTPWMLGMAHLIGGTDVQQPWKAALALVAAITWVAMLGFFGVTAIRFKAAANRLPLA